MPPGTFNYFAYGSNLLKERLQLRNPSAVFLDIAKLTNYKLTFESVKNPSNSRWRGGAASIREQKGGMVWGAVWQLNNEHLKTLDQQESGYHGFDVKVEAPSGEQFTCRTYQMKIPEGKPECDSRPSPQYKDVIVRGAQSINLPQDYIQSLQEVQDNGFSGDLPIYEEVMSLIE